MLSSIFVWLTSERNTSLEEMGSTFSITIQWFIGIIFTLKYKIYF